MFSSLLDLPGIFVNISAGTNEFAAAATMIHPNVTIFTQGELESNLTKDVVRRAYYRDGEPTGLVTRVSEPVAIDVYQVDPPDKSQSRGCAFWTRT